MTMPKENTPAPLFEAPDQSGKPVSLQSLKKHWVLLYFYPKAFTPGCTQEACEFRDFYADLKKEVEILGVSHDSVETLQRFAKTHRLPFTLLSDPEKKIIEAYGVKGWFLTKRKSFLINPEGLVARVYDSVSPAKHAQQVIEDLKQLKSGG